MSSVPFKSVHSKGSSVPPSPLANPLANPSVSNPTVPSGSMPAESAVSLASASVTSNEVPVAPKPPVAALKARQSVSATQKLSSANTVPYPHLGQGGVPQATLLVKGTSVEAGRNLALGIVCTLALVPVGGIAFWSAPRESFVALATAVLLGLALFLAIQFRVLVQKNGVFFILSACLALSLSVPIGVRLVSAGSEWAQTFAEFSRQQYISPTADGRSPSGRPITSKPSPESVSGSDQGVEAPALSRANDVPLAAGQSVSASTEPAKVSKPAAPTAPEPDPYADEDPSQKVTRLAKDEAIHRYPALQTTGTKEHQVYLDAYNELARSRKFDFFKDPKWPLKLADMVASREGWVRADDKAPAKKIGSASGPSVLPGSEFALDGQGVAMVDKTVSGAGVSAVTPVTGIVSVSAGTVSSGTIQSADEVETNKAIAEARRRYPAVGREGSPENKAYLEAYQDLDARKTDFFESPDWPLRLVELVAKQEGWKRVDSPPAPARTSGVKITDTKELPLPQ